MKNGSKSILQLHVQLDHVLPPVWRLIEVPADYTFWDLHVALQCAMGWQDCHLHEFAVSKPDSRAVVRIGLPDPDGQVDETVRLDWECRLTDFLNAPGDEAEYVYDFGDDWRHTIRVDGVAQASPKTRYPRCISGARACPPEDCGGPPGYAQLVAGDADLLEWIGGSFEPETFEASEVHFANPKVRWKSVFGGSE